LVYTIPTHHNPTGKTLSAERRVKLLELSRIYGFYIISDEVYQLLSFGKYTPPLPIALYDKAASACVFSVGSFSKILGPGMRLGWIVCKNPLLLTKMRQSGVICSGGNFNFTSAIIQSAIELGLQQKHLVFLKKEFENRSKLLCYALRRHFPSTDMKLEFSEPQGGYFVWVKLPKGVSSKHIGEKCKEVKIKPGGIFSSKEKLDDYMRLCYVYMESDEIEPGVKLLADLFRDLI